MNEANKVKEGMDVICSCGMKIGRVDRLEGDMIKLTKGPPDLNGKSRFIPVEWVESVDAVDRNVVLNRNSEEVESEWAEESLAI